MFIRKSNYKQFKQEFDDMRHNYENLKDDFENMTEVNIVLAEIINNIEKETQKNQLGSEINLQNKLIKILDDGKSKLVSICK